MKSFKKIISAFMAIILIFSAAVPSVTASQEQTYCVSKEEKSVPSTDQMLKMLAPFSIVMRLLTGKILWSRNIELKFEESIATELCEYIRDNSGLDIIKLLSSIPLESRGVDLFYDITGADVSELRENLYELSDQKYREGDRISSILLSFFTTVLTDVQEVKIFTVPWGSENERVQLDVCFADGTVKSLQMGIYFNKDGLAYNLNDTGILDLGFNCSVYDLLVYATVDSWMRDFGFCYFYDFFCYTTPFFKYNTRRFRFDYGDKEWMVQIWKGNYLITNGAECGVYNREPGSIGSYYNCSDSTMPMTMKLSHNDEVIYDIAMEHWWINGFKLSKMLYRPESLTMDFSIELPDEGMALALAEAIENEYHHDVTCSVCDKTVTAVW